MKSFPAIILQMAIQTNVADKGGNKGVLLSLVSHHQPCPHLMERFKGCCTCGLLLPLHLLLLCFSLDECDLNSHISLLFFHSDSLSHELKEDPLIFPLLKFAT